SSLRNEVYVGTCRQQSSYGFKLFVIRCDHKGGFAILVPRIDRYAARQKIANDLRLVEFGKVHENRIAVAVDKVSFRTEPDHELKEFGRCVFIHHHQRCTLLIVTNVCLCSPVQEELDHFDIAVLNGGVEG